MDYGKEVSIMLEYLSEHRSPETLSYFIRSMSYGIAQASAFLNTVDNQQQLLDTVCDAIKEEAKQLFVQERCIHGSEYLKHYFKPEKMNG